MAGSDVESVGQATPAAGVTSDVESVGVATPSAGVSSTVDSVGVATPSGGTPDLLAVTLSPPVITRGGVVMVAVTLSEAASDADLHILVENGTLDQSSGAGAARQLLLNPLSGVVGVLSVEVRAGSYVTASGILSEQSNRVSVNIDTTVADPYVAISGEPVLAIGDDEAYSFVPAVVAPEGAELQFAIDNLPAGASFSVDTGELSWPAGTFSEVSLENIAISVSHGEKQAVLGPFTVVVSADEGVDSVGSPVLPGGRYRHFWDGEWRPSSVEFS